jgi:hypothetical protein
MSWTYKSALGYPQILTTNLFGGLQQPRSYVANATYTTPTGVKSILVLGQGAGGGGGGCGQANSTQSSVAGGGAAGGWGYYFVTSPLSSYTITIGLAGTAGGAAANGGAGSNTTFVNGPTTYLNCIGGAGGKSIALGTSAVTANGGIATATGTGTVNFPGMAGGPGYRFSGTTGCSGLGGTTWWWYSYPTAGVGTTTSSAAPAPFQTGTSGGCGGSGGWANTTSGTVSGGTGSDGFVVIYEFR